MKNLPKRKKTLCLTCLFGLVREWEDWLDEPPCEISGQQAKCLLTSDFVECITSCNRYKRNENAKITYHDPDFEEYFQKVQGGAVKVYGKVKEGDKLLK